MQQQQQQQQQFTPLAGNIEKINNASGSIYRDNTPFTPIQSLIQEQQPMIDANGFSNDTNILQRRDVALSVFQNIATSNATTSTPTSTPSSIDIFEIPELPTRHPITRQSSQQSFNTKENKADEYDVFDFPPANDIPKVTKTYKSPARASPSSSSTAKPKKNADTSLDVFDFPEEDSSNIVELKIVSTRSSDTSSSSISKRGNKPLKRSSSQVNMNSTAKVLSRQQQQQQPGKPSPLKKSKSEASAKPSEKRVRFAPEILVSTFHRTSFDRSQPSSAPTFSNEPTYSSEKMGRDTFSFSIPSSSSQQQLPTKRKRNLVSRLRNATGAPSTQASAGLSLRKYNFDDDDDDDNMVEENGGNDEMVQTASATHEDELDYRRKMERELAAMMENEFGQEINEQGEQENGEQENISRPQYQPSNVMNVRVTYKSSKKQQSNSQQLHQQQQLQQDREMVELDNLLDKLRAGSTDL
ncbi:hypothetical protein BDA99DRAFT_521046 [Phascolomyces articulosus]|uniref:Uncharacterized protein n=1 Tax=Phascolomyces articulosus TaxID=60185 RepID=A0AAD5PAA4_9FUNG|nr:hypothetical protein BDA99DRAFT_521046 [Phascolomyces articulosus]